MKVDVSLSNPTMLSAQGKTSVSLYELLETGNIPTLGGVDKIQVIVATSLAANYDDSTIILVHLTRQSAVLQRAAHPPLEV
ncbi:MAG: hypothetical protein WB762_22620 [Candidatus Sulfotelmatobacter sp.]